MCCVFCVRCVVCFVFGVKCKVCTLSNSAKRALAACCCCLLVCVLFSFLCSAKRALTKNNVFKRVCCACACCVLVQLCASVLRALLRLVAVCAALCVLLCLRAFCFCVFCALHSAKRAHVFLVQCKACMLNKSAHFASVRCVVQSVHLLFALYVLRVACVACARTCGAKCTLCTLRSVLSAFCALPLACIRATQQNAVARTLDPLLRVCSAVQSVHFHFAQCKACTCADVARSAQKKNAQRGCCALCVLRCC